MTAFNVKDIIINAENRLGIKQITGAAGSMRKTHHINVQQYNEGKGFWDTIIPDTILVISPSCFSKLTITLPEARKNNFHDIISNRIICIAISKTDSSSDFMLKFSKVYDMPIFTSVYDEFLLESRLIGLIREKINNVVFIHGSLVNVYGFGVIITGDSGSGKTECAYKLARRGHVWIADDVVEIEKRNNILHGCSCVLVKHLINVKDTGIVSAKEYLGASAIRDETIIDLMIELKDESNIPIQQDCYSTEHYQNIMGFKLPYITMPAFLCDRAMYTYVERVTQKLINKRGII